MKKRFLLAALPFVLLAAGCNEIKTPEGLDLTPYKTSVYVTPNGTTYSIIDSNGTSSYTFGADAILSSHSTLGKVDFGTSPVAVYYFESADQVRFTTKAVITNGQTTTIVPVERHFHFYFDDTLRRCCYDESVPAIVYRAIS